MTKNTGLLMSVVIPAYRHCPHLPEVLTAILEGKIAPDELIVCHSGQNDPTDELAATHPTVRVLHSDTRLFAGVARNRGAEAAQGDVLAFCDADCVPDADWLRELQCALSASERVVVGAVGYARTGGYWGLSNWLCEFSEQAPWRPGGEQKGGASCNMGVDAGHFRAVGGFPEDLMISEDTTLLARLRDSGLTQMFVPSAVVRHYNQAGFSAFATHQLGLGRGFAESRLRKQLRGSAAVRQPLLSLGLWVPKTALVMCRTLTGGAHAAAIGLALLPGVLIGHLIWSWGCFRRAQNNEH